MDFQWSWCVSVGPSIVRCTTLVSDVDNGGGCTCVGLGAYAESPYLPVNYSTNIF